MTLSWHGHKLGGGNVRILVQDYKSTCSGYDVCHILTHRQHLTGYTISSAIAELKTTYQQNAKCMEIISKLVISAVCLYDSLPERSACSYLM